MTFDLHREMMIHTPWRSIRIVASLSAFTYYSRVITSRLTNRKIRMGRGSLPSELDCLGGFHIERACVGTPRTDRSLGRGSLRILPSKLHRIGRIPKGNSFGHKERREELEDLNHPRFSTWKATVGREPPRTHRS